MLPHMKLLIVPNQSLCFPESDHLLGRLAPAPAPFPAPNECYKYMANAPKSYTIQVLHIEEIRLSLIYMKWKTLHNLRLGYVAM